MADFVSSLGALTLDHRCKRLMQRLLDQADELYAELELPLKPRWCSTLLLLESEGPLRVMDIADRLRLTHPAVVQTMGDMSATGLIVRKRSSKDRRRRTAALSAKGRSWMASFHVVWREQERAIQVLSDLGTGNLVERIDRVIAELDRRSLWQRIGPRCQRALGALE